MQSGLGRTGRLFSYEYDGVQPDLVTVAKTLSGGFVPVGATLGTSWVFQRVYSSMDRMLVHDSTYGTNALAMAAGLATLSVIDDEGLIANAATVGAELMSGLRGRSRALRTDLRRPGPRTAHRHRVRAPALPAPPYPVGAAHPGPARGSSPRWWSVPSSKTIAS